MAILCAVIVCVILVENNLFLKMASNPAEDTTGVFKFSRENKKSFDVPFSPKRQNILLLGVDSNGRDTDIWEGTRSDTILVINIDPKTHSIKAISIPRDSKVYLPDNKGVQKINSAHALGGVNLVKKTLRETFGIKIDSDKLLDDSIKILFCVKYNRYSVFRQGDNAYMRNENITKSKIIIPPKNNKKAINEVFYEEKNYIVASTYYMVQHNLFVFKGLYSVFGSLCVKHYSYRKVKLSSYLFY